MGSQGKRTDVELLVDRCKGRGGTWGRTDAVVLHMEAAHGWRPERAQNAIERALVSVPTLSIGKGGTIKYSGTDAAIYQDVRHRVESTWAGRQGLRNALVRNVSSSHSAQHAGAWVYPDLILLADPRKRDTQFDALEIHTIEVERAKGFSIQSVYQAFEQGRGANYAWVFYLGERDESSSSWVRILRVAQERGVGLVGMGKPHSVETWSIKLKATRVKAPDMNDRELLLKATGLTAEQLHERRSN